MSDLAKAEALRKEGRTKPSDPAYRKPVMAGSTAGLSKSGQFPEYEARLLRQLRAGESTRHSSSIGRAPAL